MSAARARPALACIGTTAWPRRCCSACCALLALFLLAPLAAILVKSVQDKSGAFVGLLQFREYFATPALQSSIWNTFWVAMVVTGITVPLAFAYAYALTRSCMRGKVLFRVIALTPILAPSLMSAISFIQWFGNQGALKSLLGGATIYGPLGIILSAIYATFPHALMIVLTALLLADGRLYEAAESLRTPTLRRFFTITLPGAKFGLVSATMVVFSYTVSDFGIPKVIGGNFNVLAVDIYKQVIGQQNFNKGAVVSLVLLLPVLLAFIVDWIMQRRLQAQFSARAVPYSPKRVALVRPRDVPVLPARRAAAARGPRHGRLHVVHQVLALRQVAVAAALPVRPRRRGRALVVFQQPQDGAGGRPRRHRLHLRRARTCSRRRAACR